MKSPSGGRLRLRRLGRDSWALLGIAAVAAVIGYVLSLLALVVVPAVLALFPATLLTPLSARLRERRVPRTAAAMIVLVGAVLLFGAAGGVTATLVVNGLPEVVDSVGDGISEVESVIQHIAPDFQLRGADDLMEFLGEQFQEEDGEGWVPQLLRLTTGVFGALAGTVLLVVILFFYLRNGRVLAERGAGLLGDESARRVMERADTAWHTLGAYFRGQLLVALVDAVLIGLALLLLGVPLALPLAVLVFLGGLFPIVGAVVTGAVAVLVALSDGGLTMGLIVAGVVVAVQQLESQVVAPLVLGRAIDLHPLAVIVSITAGGLLFGILGAFLAVPVVAIFRDVWAS